MSNLHLPLDLEERREVLETELNKVVVELTSNKIKNALYKICQDNGLEISRISWEFRGEYDD